MNKKITLGAASIALAAMPVAGVFAATQTYTVTDKLNATVLSACEFTRYGEAGTLSPLATGEVAPAWDGPTTSGTADRDSSTITGHTYSASIKPSTDVELGTSHFMGYCNDAAGFSVTVVTPDLADGTKTLAYSTADLNASTGEGWTLTRSVDGGTAAVFANGAGVKFMDGTAGPTDASNAKTATATYKVFTKSDTKSGAYKGDVVYTFTYND